MTVWWFKQESENVQGTQYLYSKHRRKKWIKWWIVNDNTLYTHNAVLVWQEKRQGYIIQYQSHTLLAIIIISSDSWIFSFTLFFLINFLSFFLSTSKHI